MAAFAVAAQAGESPFAETQSYYEMIRDDMSDYFGEERQSAEFKERMRQCMIKWEDDDLPEGMDAYWKGAVDYFNAHPAEDDWVDCDEHPTDTHCVFSDQTPWQMRWLEFAKAKGFARFGEGTGREYLSFEKCNEVSNQAYARAAMQVCDYPDWNVDTTWRRALKRALFGLQFGSTGMHMTHTEWGQTFDDDLMAVVTYVGYQGLVSQLNITDPQVLSLSYDPQMDAREAADKIAFLAVEHPDARTWNETVTALHPQFPYEYYKTFAGNAILVMAFVLPAFILEPFAKFLLNVLMADPSMHDAQIWARDQYLPAILNTISPNFHIGLGNKIKLIRRFIGALIKVGYAFLWQE